MIYNAKAVEAKWQKFWQANKVFRADEDPGKEKYYTLEMYPYPSGELHMGHVRNYILGDVVARYKRMKGYNVLHPIGWDAFGLPTENAAIRRSIMPQAWNRQCTERMAMQFRSLGISYDWDRVIDTSEQSYYTWMQWFLIRFWEKGLLYRDKMMINWCTGCNTVLANEQVENGACARCGSAIEEKMMEQWFFKVTAYADRLWDDLVLLTEWPQRVIAMQRHWLGKNESGEFKIRDWCISRQRYWGAPIPFVECEVCGLQPVKDDQLPVVLPPEADINPGWPPPLARIPSFVNTACPKCGGAAKRITDTLDTFVFSAWYYLRFVDPHNDKAPFSRQAAEYWMPVDQYVGGIEHATVHLIYSRFFHKVLFDLGLVSHPEPFRKLFTQGMVCKDGKKMSKSKGNVVTPDELIEKFGADTARLYTLFLGPPELDVEWNNRGIKGCEKMIQRIHGILGKSVDDFRNDWKKEIGKTAFSGKDADFRRLTHQAIKRITASIEDNFHFHTAISSLMDWTRAWKEYLNSGAHPLINSEALETVALLLSPFAPHLAEEIWHKLGRTDSVCFQLWPDYEKTLITSDQVQFIIQVNGKTRTVMTVARTIASDQVTIEPLAQKKINIIAFNRVVFIPGRLINFITA